MKIRVRRASRTLPSTDLIAVGLWKGKGNRWLGKDLKERLKKEGFTAKAGESRLLTLPNRSAAKNLLIIGLGEEGKFEPDRIRQGAAIAIRNANKIQARRLSIEDFPTPTRMHPEERGRHLAEGLTLGAYTFDLYKSEENATKKTVREVEILTEEASLTSLMNGIRQGEVAASATNYARDLVNIPPSDMTPRRMVQEARQIARQARISLRVLDRKKCERLGMGGFLAVARGSEEPPFLIHLTYRPPSRPRRRIALVGKGITFDSGGLSLKTAQGMETMKSDMSGAASVLAIFKTLPTLRPSIEVHGIAAVTENLPSGTAGKPGDIVRTLTGKTIEILNTDAEGRLTLADAIPYDLRQRPDMVIDLATLTGACVVALGDLCSGIMGNDQPLIDRIIASGRAAGEKIWQLPLIEEYQEELKSPFADLKNIGGKWGGTITAGLFLREFVDPKIPWAHIDIAGPAWAEKEWRLGPRGGTGVLVRTLLHFILSQDRRHPA